jgi:hypothetical protein
MDDQTRDYAVGSGKPPVETRFQKGQSGNPEGRPRGRGSLVALLGDALSHRSGMRNPDGSYKTQAEAIFAGLVGVAAGPGSEGQEAAVLCADQATAGEYLLAAGAAARSPVRREPSRHTGRGVGRD